MSKTPARYWPGTATGVSLDGLTLLAAIPPGDDLAIELAELVTGNGTADDLVWLLLRGGPNATPDFALCEERPDGVRVVVRGAGFAILADGSLIQGGGIFHDRLVGAGRVSRLLLGDEPSGRTLPAPPALLTVAGWWLGDIDVAPEPAEATRPRVVTGPSTNMVPTGTELADASANCPAVAEPAISSPEAVPTEPRSEEAGGHVAQPGPVVSSAAESKPPCSMVKPNEEAEASVARSPYFDILNPPVDDVDTSAAVAQAAEVLTDSAQQSTHGLAPGMRSSADRFGESPIAEPEGAEPFVAEPAAANAYSAPAVVVSPLPPTATGLIDFPFADDDLPTARPPSHPVPTMERSAHLPADPLPVETDPMAAEPPASAPLAGAGSTVRRSDIQRELGVTQEVFARYCLQGHLTQANDPRCRVCGGPVSPQSPEQRIPRPTLGYIVLPTGERYPIDRPLIMGREPRVPDSPLGETPNLVKIEDPRSEVSSQHLLVRPDHWSVVVIDLGSTNGTEVVHRDGRQEKLIPKVELEIDGGARIRLADILELVFEVTQ